MLGMAPQQKKKETTEKVPVQEKSEEKLQKSVEKIPVKE